MIRLTVVSGKGGTGKTSLTASLAALARDAVLADGDVDAADLHLVLDPAPAPREPFVGGLLARIDPASCTGCGTCVEVCRFEAAGSPSAREAAAAPTSAPNGLAALPCEVPRIDETRCEGCMVCRHFCPEGAISTRERVTGWVSVTTTRHGPLVHARLVPGGENSGKLVAEVRRRAEERARQEARELVLIDGPPGIGCPVMAAVTGVEYALVITEPTPSGLHDLERLLEVLERLRVPAGVCVNKHDLHPENTARIHALAEARGLDRLGDIRYDRAVTEAQRLGLGLIEHTEGGAAQDVRQLWNVVRRRLAGDSKGMQV